LVWWFVERALTRAKMAPRAKSDGKRLRFFFLFLSAGALLLLLA
jgi:hypothetical protein